MQLYIQFSSHAESLDLKSKEFIQENQLQYEGQCDSYYKFLCAVFFMLVSWAMEPFRSSLNFSLYIDIFLVLIPYGYIIIHGTECRTMFFSMFGREVCVVLFKTLTLGVEIVSTHRPSSLWSSCKHLLCMKTLGPFIFKSMVD